MEVRPLSCLLGSSCPETSEATKVLVKAAISGRGVLASLW
jgi:hypothetical protein